MEKAILLSIQPQHAAKILNGNKTLELRKSVPKDFVGWVYLYCTKSIKDILYKYKDKYYTQHYLTFTDSVEVLNSKVVARFWFDDYIAYKYYEDDNSYFAKRPQDFGYGAEEVLKRLCLSRDEFKAYGKGKDLYAWHIDNLVIFDEPMELRDFSIFKTMIPPFLTAIFSCGMDCPPYTDRVEYRVRKAPQSWQYVYTKMEQ